MFESAIKITLGLILIFFVLILLRKPHLGLPSILMEGITNAIFSIPYLILSVERGAGCLEDK